MNITLVEQADEYAKYEVTNSPYNQGEDWVLEVFKVSQNHKNCGFEDDNLDDGWYWFCPADQNHPDPQVRGPHGPFDSQEAAIKAIWDK